VKKIKELRELLHEARNPVIIRTLQNDLETFTAIKKIIDDGRKEQ